MDTFEARRQLYSTSVQQHMDQWIGTEDGYAAILTEAMRYSSLGGGKRLRGLLCLEFCRIGCGDWKRALPFAAAVEMIHAYSLIHDDLPCMDDDNLRRGKPACHVRFGEANALLAGDALLTGAFECALSGMDFSVVEYAHVTRALQTLAQCAGMRGMVGGQVIDLLYENADTVAPELLRVLHAKKTGALIRGASLSGAMVGGMGEDGLLFCESYAQHLGLAFQIVDDILDETSTAVTLGKSVGKDRAHGKTTYVTLYGVTRAEEMARECVEQAKAALANLHISDRFLYDVADWVSGRDR